MTEADPHGQWRQPSEPPMDPAQGGHAAWTSSSDAQQGAVGQAPASWNQGAPAPSPWQQGAPGGAPQGVWAGPPGVPAGQAGPWGPQPQGGAQLPPAPPVWGDSAPRPGIIPLRPLGLAELFEGTFRAVRANPSVMFGFSMAVMALVALVAGILQFFAWDYVFALAEQDLMTANAEDQLTQTAAAISGMIFSTLFSSGLIALSTTILTGILAITVHDAVLGRKASVGDAWRAVAPRVLPLLGVSILISLIQIVVLLVVGAPVGLGVWAIVGSNPEELSPGAIVGVVLLVLLAFLLIALAVVALSVKLVFAPLSVVLEHQGPIAALGRSWKLTKGAFWRTLGRYWLMGMVLSFASGLLGGFAGAIASLFVILGSPAVGQAATMFLSTLLSGIVLPLSGAFVTLMFIDERMRSEGIAAQLAEAARQ
ncbi:hypothetical protein I6B53_04225 [Schaalia sp. 19OD2882]|uniref:DUF7544 domain-containing protein n=1 Tax=Schaalia sp. 19OD2882 TaxID=2794089 RepID=UPI001C1F104E|nr:hypothetical protein [Schaalia sp. 19OD2882]QWW20305.1 hypothetical protein I6B53_04225 [Schaalia sp. 19OD2882]